MAAPAPRSALTAAATRLALSKSGLLRLIRSEPSASAKLVLISRSISAPSGTRPAVGWFFVTDVPPPRRVLARPRGGWRSPVHPPAPHPPAGLPSSARARRGSGRSDFPPPPPRPPPAQRSRSPPVQI